MLGVPVVRRDGRAWVVRLTDHDGQLRELRYRHESQARFFAAVFRMHPPKLPEQGTMPPKRKRVSRIVPGAVAASHTLH